MGLNSDFLKNGGSSNMAVDGSITPVLFTFGPPVGEFYRVTRLIICLRSTSIGVNDFGGIVGGLANGLECYVDRAGANIRNLFPVPIKTNGQFSQLCYDLNLVNWGAGVDTLVARYTLAKETFDGLGIFLNGDADEKIVLKVQDNLGDLTDLTIKAGSSRGSSSFSPILFE